MRPLPYAMLLLAAIAAAQGQPSATVGGPVPDYEFAPLFNGDGRQRLSEFYGSPVLIEYWGQN